jgi:hypothetical protein
VGVAARVYSVGHSIWSFGSFTQKKIKVITANIIIEVTNT